MPLLNSPIPSRVSRHRAIAALAAALAACAAACGDDEPVVSHGLVAVPTSPAVTLAVGDTTSVRLAWTAGSSGAAQWATSDPGIVRIDSLGAGGTSVRVRAVGVGTAGLRYTATSEAQTISGSIPVTVSAAR